MNSNELKKQTNKLAIDIIRLTDKLPKFESTRILSNQIISSATSLATNYRVACRARYKSGFVNKIKIVEEEADITLFWI